MRPRSSAAASKPPRRFEQYVFNALIGSGGFGRVYAAWDEQLKRRVAIKILKPGDTRTHTRRLLAEARHAARLQHPAFVQIHTFLTLDRAHDLHAIVMELVSGETLCHRFDQKAATPATVLDVGAQVAAAMATAHAAGIVHGDLKTSNLMLQAGTTVRILDLGMARTLGDSTQPDSKRSTGAGGTLAYMAPELLLGEMPNPSSDIYALGVVLFELLHGRRPFATAGSTATLAHAILYGDTAAAPRRNSGAARALDELIADMMSRPTAHRPQSMAEVVARIDRIRTLGSADRRVVSIAAPPRDPPPSPNTPRAAAACSLLVLATLMASGWHPLGMPPTAPQRVASLSTVDSHEVDALLSNFDDQGTVDRAIAMLESGVANDRSDADIEALLAIAYCLKYAGGARDPAWLAGAKLSAQRALALDDQLALAQVAQAWAFEFGGDDRQAESSYRKALLLDPLNLHGLTGYARLLTRQARYADAESLLIKALATYPDERLLHDALGTIRYRQADYRSAEAEFRRSIVLKRDGVYAYANLNAALLRQGRAEEALNVLQQGLRIRPDGRLYSNLGTALFAQAHFREAVDAFEHAVSARWGSPNDYLKWANLGDGLRYLPGRGADARLAYLRALHLIEPELQRVPPDATAFSRGAVYAARVGDRARATAWLTIALHAQPASADVLFRAILIDEALHARSAALAHLEQALNAGFPTNAIATEPDLADLRLDPAYAQAIADRIGRTSMP